MEKPSLPKTLFLQIAASALFFSISTASASGLPATSHPSIYCSLGAEIGYPSRGYKEHTGGCASNMIDITRTPGENGLRNNLAFYTMGKVNSPSKLERISLILNINNIRQKTLAQRELTRAAKILASKLTGTTPPDISSTITKSSSKTWHTGEWTIEVKSSIWPTGLGQDIAVYFRPSSQQ